MTPFPTIYQRLLFEERGDEKNEKVGRPSASVDEAEINQLQATSNI